MWEISHQWCERIWLIYNLCHDRNMENVTPGMQKNQLQFEASIEKITTVENGTPGMWKRRVQFEASTEKITTVENGTPEMWTSNLFTASTALWQNLHTQSVKASNSIQSFNIQNHRRDNFYTIDVNSSDLFVGHN